MALQTITAPASNSNSVYSAYNSGGDNPDGSYYLDPATYNNDWQQNPNYILTLYNNGAADTTKASVQAYLPEQFHFRLENLWEPLLSSLGNVAETLDKFNNVANLGNYSFNAKFLSALIWKRAEPMSFQFTLNFDDKTSSYKDVKTPVANLIYMCSPSRGSGVISGQFLSAPGQSFGNPGNRISMKIGRFFYCDSVVIDSMDVTWYTAFENSGDPIAADVEISMRAWYTPDRDDILNFFGMADADKTSYIKSVPQDYSNAPPIYSPAIGSVSDYFSSITNSQAEASKQSAESNASAPL